MDDYDTALDAFKRAFNERDLPGHLSSVRREAQRRNRYNHRILISHFQSEWEEKNPDIQLYFKRLHRRMDIVAKKYNEDGYTDPLTIQSLVNSDLKDEITLQDGTYQRRMCERYQYVVRSLADVLEYQEEQIPDEMRKFLHGNDSPSRGPERGAY